MTLAPQQSSMPSPPNPSLPFILALSLASCTGPPQNTLSVPNEGLLTTRGPSGTSTGRGPPSSLKDPSIHLQTQKSMKIPPQPLPIPPSSEQLTEHLLSLDLGFNVLNDQLLRESIGVIEMAENDEQELTRLQVGFRIQPSAHQRRTQERDEYEHFWGEDDSDDEWGEQSLLFNVVISIQHQLSTCQRRHPS